ncbi:ribosomal protein-related [Striga hermonthica]|uniref:Ribosomal protein-related n=1 Tax=Striga hermonthica TaxID=68872 RepID=A0A9N7NIE5_STRHE|nr:ribosomal protein-related [Striga hermonthica]
MPNPRELVAHYENQGMETQDASLKVIQDLQGALFRVVSSGRRKLTDTASSKSPDTASAKSPDITSAKLNAIHSRLVALEMKLDSKPSYPQAVAVGVASAGIWNAVVQLWGLVKRVNSSSP